jgi:hypothetical protein
MKKICIAVVFLFLVFFESGAAEIKVKNLPGIRMYATLYTYALEQEPYRDFIYSHYDMSTVGTPFTSEGLPLTSVKLHYRIFPYVRQTAPIGYYDLYKFAVDKNAIFDDLFYHYVKDTATDKNYADLKAKGSSQVENRFHKVYTTDDGIKFADFTPDVYGIYYDGDQKNQSDFNINICKNNSSALYIGHPFKYKELNINVSKPSDIGVSFQYPAPFKMMWQALPVVDATKGMKQPGKITFDPPANWIKTGINGDELYWIRIKCNSGTGPVTLQTTKGWTGTPAISGEEYLNKDGFFTLLGWDDANDANQDGFVDNNEFAAKPNINASARFKYQARVVYSSLGGIYPMNLSNQTLKEYAVDYALNKVFKELNMEGLFLDEYLSGPGFDYLKGATPYLEMPDALDSYDQQLSDFVKYLKTAVGDQKFIITNGGIDEPAIYSETDGMMVENYIGRTLSFGWEQHSSYYFTRIGAFLEDACQKGKYIVLDSTLFTKKADDADLWGKEAIYDLATYYLLSNSCTLFMHQYDHSYPWNDWFDALAYDIGKPVGNYYIYDELPKEIGAENLIKNPSFEAVAKADANGIPTPWTGYGDIISYKIDPENSKDGQKSFYMEKKSVGKINAGIAQTLFKLKSNTDYTLRAYIKTSNLKGTVYINHEAASLYVSNTDPKNGLEFLVMIPPGTNDWMPIDMVFKTGNVSAVSGLYIRISNNATGGIWVDDVRLMEGIYPVTRIFARKFSNGLVLLKPPRYFTSPNDETTAYKMKLDGKYRRLGVNGSLSDVIEEISLNDLDAAILVPEPVSAPPPDETIVPPDTVEPPAPPPPDTQIKEQIVVPEQTIAPDNVQTPSGGAELPPEIPTVPVESPVDGGCSLIR